MLGSEQKGQTILPSWCLHSNGGRQVMTKPMQTIYTMSDSDRGRKGRLDLHCVCVCLCVHMPTHILNRVAREDFNERVKFEVIYEIGEGGIMPISEKGTFQVEDTANTKPRGGNMLNTVGNSAACFMSSFKNIYYSPTIC